MNGNMESNIKLMAERIAADKVKRTMYREKITACKENIEQLDKDTANCTKARVAVQAVAERIQSKVETHLSNLGTMALSAVFPDPYEFRAKFESRRNKAECDLLFVKDGQEVDPLSAAGGGAIDVASFALRAAVWGIRPTRPCFLLDEPFRFVSIDLQEKCSEMLKKISETLGVQMIMVSHLPNIIGSADEIFKVNYVNGESKVSKG